MKRAAIAIAITIGVFVLGGILQIFSVETTVIIALAAGALYIAVSWPRAPAKTETPPAPKGTGGGEGGGRPTS